MHDDVTKNLENRLAEAQDLVDFDCPRFQVAETCRALVEAACEFNRVMALASPSSDRRPRLNPEGKVYLPPETEPGTAPPTQWVTPPDSLSEEALKLYRYYERTCKPSVLVSDNRAAKNLRVKARDVKRWKQELIEAKLIVPDEVPNE